MSSTEDNHHSEQSIDQKETQQQNQDSIKDERAVEIEVFIAMPYGERTDRLNPLKIEEEEVKINFDEIWNTLYKKTFESIQTIKKGGKDHAVSFKLRRADEMELMGIIEEHYIKSLYDSTIVLADLTFGNANVFYELGIRQVLKPGGTILVAQKGSYIPFDVAGQRIWNYDWLKSDFKTHSKVY